MLTRLFGFRARKGEKVCPPRCPTGCVSSKITDPLGFAGGRAPIAAGEPRSSPQDSTGYWEWSQAHGPGVRAGLCQRHAHCAAAREKHSLTRIIEVCLNECLIVV